MSAQPHRHHVEGHTSFCAHPDITARGHQCVETLTGEGWQISLHGPVHPEMPDGGLSAITLRTLPALHAVAFATALTLTADTLDGAPFDHGVLWGPDEPKTPEQVTIPDEWIAPDEQGGEDEWVELAAWSAPAARQLTAVLLRMAQMRWDWEQYRPEQPAEQPMRDVRSGASDGPPAYGDYVLDGLNSQAERRIARRIVAKARRLPRSGASWPVVLWGSDHGDPIGAAIGQVPWVWSEYTGYDDPGWSGVSVPLDALHGLSAEQVTALADEARTAYLTEPRAVPPRWAVGGPDADGNRLGSAELVPYETPVGISEPITVRAEWCQSAPADSRILVGQGPGYYFSAAEARALADALIRHADLIEGRPA